MAEFHFNTIHGLSGTPEFKTWDRIKTRCLNPRQPQWKDYGGRGIKICGYLLSSAGAFYSTVGPRPDPSMQIDRKDNDGHYSCGQCSECLENGWPMNLRWATRTQNARNKRSNRIVECNGEKMCLAEWCDRHGLKRSVVATNIQRGKSLDEILSGTNTKRKTNPPKTFTFAGESLRVREWAKRFNVREEDFEMFRNRIRTGWNPEIAARIPRLPSRKCPYSRW